MKYLFPWVGEVKYRGRVYYTPLRGPRRDFFLIPSAAFGEKRGMVVPLYLSAEEAAKGEATFSHASPTDPDFEFLREVYIYDLSEEERMDMPSLPPSLRREVMRWKMKERKKKEREP